MKRTVVVLLATLLVVSTFAPIAASASVASSGAVASDASSGSVNGAAADANCEYPATYTDATGEEITLEEAPDAVVALQPSDAQTVFEIGAEDRLVGMPDNPATEDLEMGDITPISDGYELNPEQVVALDPDVALAANATPDDDVEELRSAGIDVYVFAESDSIEQVQENVLRTGELVGDCDGATDTVDWMDERLETIENATADLEDRPLAFYDMQGGITAGEGSFHGDVLETAGLENLGSQYTEGWGPVSPEDIVAEDPDWILRPAETDGEFEFSAGVEETSGYEQGNVLEVDDNAMNQPAPQVVLAVEDIVAEIYPDEYAEIEATLEEIDEEYESHSDTGEAENGDDGSGGEDDGSDTVPGFGVPVAATALLAATIVTLRRR